MVARNRPTTRHVTFSGLNDTKPAVEVGFDALTVANNVDVDDSLHVRRRPGYARVYNAPIDALWSSGDQGYFFSGGSLYRYDGTGAPEDIGTALTTTGVLHGVLLPTGDVALTTGVEMCVVSQAGEKRAYGLEVPPAFAAQVTIGGGSLRAGRIQLALVPYEPGVGEGGASNLQVVEVGSGDAVQVTLPATPHAMLRLYASAPNGTELFLVGAGAGGGQITYSGVDQRAAYTALSTFNHGLPPEAARTIVEHGGRMMYAVDNVLWYSEAFAYERFHLAHNYIQFPSNINMLASVDAGLIVGTEKSHVLLRGEDVTQASPTTVVSYGAALCQPMMLENDQHEYGEGTAYAWIGKRGIVIGLDDGQIINATSGTVSVSAGAEGSLALRESDDFNQAVVSVRY